MKTASRPLLCRRGKLSRRIDLVLLFRARGSEGRLVWRVRSEHGDWEVIPGGVLCLLVGQEVIWRDVSLDFGFDKDREDAYKAARCVRSFSR